MALTSATEPLAAATGAVTGTVPLSEAELLPPLNDTSKVLCVGLNYRDHVLEMGRELPLQPTVFVRYPDSLVGPGASLVRPAESEQFDYEGELAVVIGAGGRRIAAEDAFDHVLGYTVMNDGSLRDFQRHTTQFTPGKNFVASGSLGPVIVTADEVKDLAGCSITTRLSGEVVQQSALGQLIFGIPRLIAYVSAWTDLRPGDVIATGTPGGVGDGREPKLWMRPGDLVEVEIERIGLLRNSVLSE